MHRAEKRRHGDLTPPVRGAPLPPPEQDAGPGGTPSGPNNENQVMARTQGAWPSPGLASFQVHFRPWVSPRQTKP